jgi:hypothetical protein
MKKGWRCNRGGAMGWNGREVKNGNHASHHSHFTRASHCARCAAGLRERRALL